MALTTYQKENAENVEKNTVDFLIDLVEADPNLSSEVRREYYELLSELLTDLGQAISLGDVDDVEKRVEAIEDVQELIEWNNEAALQELKQLYGNFVEDVLNIESRSIINLVFLAIKDVWHSYQRSRPSSKQIFTIPDDVLGYFQVEVVRTVDALFIYHARRFESLKQIQVLTIQDIIGLGHLYKPMKSAAIRAIQFYLLTEKDREDQEDDSNIFEKVWDVFGYDSFSEFAFDVVLFVGTGGISGVYKAGRIVVKGVKVVRKVRKNSKRLFKTLRVTKESIKRAKQQQKTLRARLKKYSKKNKKIPRKQVQTGLRQQSARIRNLYKQAFEIIASLKKSKAAIKQISKALKPIQDVMRGVVTNKASKTILSKEFDSYSDTAREEAGKAAMKTYLKRYVFFGDGIKRLQNVAIMSLLGINKKRKFRVFTEWWMRLFIRQILVYALIEIARKKSLSGKTFHVILNKSFVAATEEVLAAFLPKSLAVELFSNVYRKVITGITDKLGDIIFKHLVNIYKSL